MDAAEAWDVGQHQGVLPVPAANSRWAGGSSPRSLAQPEGEGGPPAQPGEEGGADLRPTKFTTSGHRSSVDTLCDNLGTADVKETGN